MAQNPLTHPLMLPVPKMSDILQSKDEMRFLYGYIN